jgi:hypothetical protein
MGCDVRLYPILLLRPVLPLFLPAPVLFINPSFILRHHSFSLISFFLSEVICFISSVIRQLGSIVGPYIASLFQCELCSFICIASKEIDWQERYYQHSYKWQLNRKAYVCNLWYRAGKPFWEPVTIFGEILLRACGNFELQNGALELCIIIINYYYINYMLQLYITIICHYKIVTGRERKIVESSHRKPV